MDRFHSLSGWNSQSLSLAQILAAKPVSPGRESHEASDQEFKCNIHIYSVYLRGTIHPILNLAPFWELPMSLCPATDNGPDTIHIRGFPKIRVTFLEVPIIKIIVFGGLFLGSPFFGSYHI